MLILVTSSLALSMRVPDLKPEPSTLIRRDGNPAWLHELRICGILYALSLSLRQRDSHDLDL